jgi:hypothetical protein
MTQQNLTQAGKVGVIRRARAHPSGCIEGVSLSHAGQDDGVGQNAVEAEKQEDNPEQQQQPVPPALS